MSSSPRRPALFALALLACATPAPFAAAAPLLAAQGQFEVEVLSEGAAAPRFFHAGESYVLGRKGDRYTLRVWNRSWRRVEAVVSVDGRDVIDGKDADYREKRGYVIPAGGFVDIDGWRLSGREAAAFRFSAVADSYVAQTGNARNVGVIGVAIFPERAWPAPPPPHWSQWPHWPHGLAPGARDGGGESRRSEAPPAPGASAPSAGEASAAAAKSPPPAKTAEAESAQADRGPGVLRGRAPTSRPGLGTAFGERVVSPIHETKFTRAESHVPLALIGLRYNDRRGLVAIGIDVDGFDNLGRELDRRQAADPFPVSARAYASPPPGWRR